jgi:hypothetical protein
LSDLKQIVINKDRLPIELRSATRVLAMEYYLLNDLSKRVHRNAASAHEAGHEHYYACCNCLNIRREGPAIIYDPALSESVIYARAAVKCDIPPYFPLKDLAICLAAGEIVQRELVRADGMMPGDGMDLKTFQRICKMEHKDISDASISMLWENAKAKITSDLRRHEFKKSLRQRAADFGLEVFGVRWDEDTVTPARPSDEVCDEVYKIAQELNEKTVCSVTEQRNSGGR